MKDGKTLLECKDKDEMMLWRDRAMDHERYAPHNQKYHAMISLGITIKCDVMINKPISIKLVQEYNRLSRFCIKWKKDNKEKMLPTMLD